MLIFIIYIYISIYIYLEICSGVLIDSLSAMAPNRKTTKLFIDTTMDKCIIVSLHNGVLFSSENEIGIE